MVDVDAIRRIARRRVSSDRWEDVAQTACLLALKRDSLNRLHVLDAIRMEFGDWRRSPAEAMRHASPIEHPEWIASHYATPAELWERWQDEQSEDQAEEWQRMPAAERDKRVAESLRDLGTSEDASGR